MTSRRKQTNVRLSDAGTERLERLVRELSDSLGVPQTQSTVVDMALALLELNRPRFPDPVVHPPLPAEPAPAPKPRGRPRKAP